MDKALGVIGLIVVAAIIFVLSINDQTPPVASRNEKVSRQKIEATTNAPVTDLASKVPSRESDATSLSSQPAGDPAVVDLKEQLKTERDRTAQLTDKLGAAEQGSAAKIAELTSKLDAAQHGSAAQVAGLTAELNDAKRGSAAQVADLTGKLDAAQHGSAAQI